MSNCYFISQDSNKYIINFKLENPYVNNCIFENIEINQSNENNKYICNMGENSRFIKCNFIGVTAINLEDCIIEECEFTNCYFYEEFGGFMLTLNRTHVYNSNFTNCTISAYYPDSKLTNCVFDSCSINDMITLQNSLAYNSEYMGGEIKLYNTTFNDTYYINNKPIDPKPYFIGVLEEIESLPDYSINKLFIDTTSVTGGLKYYNGSEWVAVPFSI